MRKWFGLAAPAAILVGVLCAALLPGAAQGDSGSILSITPASQVFPATQAEVSVDVTIDDVTNLGAFEFRMAYDPALLEVKSVTASGFLGSSGRSVHCLTVPPIVGTVGVGCATTGSVIPGPSGGATLGTVVFKPLAAGSSSLVFNKIELSDASDLANPIAVGVPNGAVVKLTNPDGSSPGSTNTDNTPEPTPTANVRLLTPTAARATPTQDNEYRLTDGNSDPFAGGSDPGNGSGATTDGTPLSSSGATGDPDASGTPNSGVAGAEDTPSSGGGGGIGNRIVDGAEAAGRFPIAGYGMVKETSARLALWARIVLLVGIGAVAAGTFMRSRRIDAG